MGTEARPCDDGGRKWPYTRKGKGLSEKKHDLADTLILEF